MVLSSGDSLSNHAFQLLSFPDIYIIAINDLYHKFHFILIFSNLDELIYKISNRHTSDFKYLKIYKLDSQLKKESEQ